MSEAGASDRLGALLAPAERAFAIDPSPAQRRALEVFATRLLEWNRRINLTGARDLETLALEHIADAFALVAHLPRSGRWVDVGSGGGLPGLVLAILRPDLDLTMLEPILKRRSFLASMVRELGLLRVTVSSERLEEHARRHSERYDAAIARAVFPLPEWLRVGRVLVRPGGVVIGLAGGSAEGAPPDAEIHRYDVGAGPRSIVIVRK